MIFSNHTFLTSASFATSGSELTPPGVTNPLSKVVVEFYGTPSSKTVLFEGVGTVGAYLPIVATNLSTNTTASQTTATADEIWSIPIAGLTKVRTRISAISGSITAMGQVII
jgi:hypothetical protein